MQWPPKRHRRIGGSAEALFHLPEIISRMRLVSLVDARRDRAEMDICSWLQAIPPGSPYSALAGINPATRAASSALRNGFVRRGRPGAIPAASA